MTITQDLLDKLLEEAKGNARLRTNFDLRTSAEDGSQRMLNAMLPETEVTIHRHPMSNENVILIKGKLDEVLYEEVTSADGKQHDEGDTYRPHIPRKTFCFALGSEVKDAEHQYANDGHNQIARLYKPSNIFHLPSYI